MTVYKPNEILADLNETFQAAMCYVILSRIMSIQQLFLLPFDQAKIYCNENAKMEAEKLKDKAINRRLTRWDIEQDDVFKISTLNVRSLQKHLEDFANDSILQKSDIICINETWLVQAMDTSFENFHKFYINAKSKGIALFSKIKPVQIKKYEDEMASVILASYQTFDLIAVYRFSENTQLGQFTNLIHSLLNLSRTIVICGDVNVDLVKYPTNNFSQYLFGLGFIQLVNTPTHIQGGIIDHVYFYSPQQVQCSLFKIHPLYFSDHDAVTFFLDMSKL